MSHGRLRSVLAGYGQPTTGSLAGMAARLGGHLGQNCASVLSLAQRRRRRRMSQGAAAAAVQLRLEVPRDVSSALLAANYSQRLAAQIRLDRLGVSPAALIVLNVSRPSISIHTTLQFTVRAPAAGFASTLAAADWTQGVLAALSASANLTAALRASGAASGVSATATVISGVPSMELLSQSSWLHSVKAPRRLRRVSASPLHARARARTPARTRARTRAHTYTAAGGQCRRKLCLLCPWAPPSCCR
jgi:hypothetical protein